MQQHGGRVIAPDDVMRDDREAIDRALVAFCESYLDQVPGQLADAIRYALEGQGKRLRGILVCGGYRAAGGTGNCAPLAAAVEVIHTYSLSHDDLPCMDDDDMRRGRPTLHRVFGVPIATAAGVAMVPLAARAACDAAYDLGLDDREAGLLVSGLMAAAGAGGMIGGQLLDLESEGRTLTVLELERVHRLKTGALIRAAVCAGGQAAGASPVLLDALEHYGSAIGLAFQIADDLLDVTGSSDTLGKTAGRDALLRKSTYPALLGVDGAAARARSLVDDACAALAMAGVDAPMLVHLARYVVQRRS
jgi:farnesyl diphosphate synthase/geranylgeranyl diphosphate synthase type II